MIRRDYQAVSPIISAVLLLMIMITIVGAILAWGIPLLRDQEADTKYDASINYFKALDATIEDLINSGNGTTRTVNMAISDGNIFVENNDKRWLISYSLDNKSIFISGLDNSDGIFEVEHEKKILRIEIYHPIGYDLGVPREYNSTSGTFYTNESFNGTVHGKIYTSSMQIAEFWLFDTDAIMHKLPAGYIKEENFAVTTNYPELGIMYVKNKPKLLEQLDNNYLSFSMLQLKSTGIGSGGQGNYAITCRLQETALRHSGEIYNLTFQIYGEHNDDWYRYIYDNYKFLPILNENKIDIKAVRYDLDNSNSINFKLLQYKMDVNLEGR